MIQQQLGEKCYIDGTSIFSKYNAELVDRSTGSITLTRNLRKYLGGHKIFHGYENYAIGNMTLQFYVYGSSRTISEQNASKLVAALNDCILTFGEDEFEYPAGLTEYDISFSEITRWTEVTAKVDAIKRGSLISQTAHTTILDINNPGDLVCGCKITTELDNTTFTVTDHSGNLITCSGLTSGKEFCIDGLEGSVTMGGTNAFILTDLVKFPTMRTGMNELVFSKAYCNLQFYPLYFL